VIERGRAYANANVSGRAQLRHCQILAVFQLLQAAVGGDRQASHAVRSGYIPAEFHGGANAVTAL
jgi:hypothetical protein